MKNEDDPTETVVVMVAVIIFSLISWVSNQDSDFKVIIQDLGIRGVVNSAPSSFACDENRYFGLTQRTSQPHGFIKDLKNILLHPQFQYFNLWMGRWLYLVTPTIQNRRHYFYR